MNKKSTVTIGDNNYDLPLIDGTIGPSVIDVSKLYGDSNYFTYDPGFTSTASCKSSITYIDGDKGECFYRGYPMDILAEESNFLEIVYLLWQEELPDKKQWSEFSEAIKNHTMVHEQFKNFFNGFRRASHPMAITVACVAALSAFYPDSTNVNDLNQRVISARRMIAKVPTLAAMAYKYSIGQPFIYPDNSLNYTENFLKMCFAVPAETYKVNKTFARALDKIFILHADHEQNASTSTVRLAASSGVNPFASISTGFTSLWGPLHGGANEAALNMLKTIGDVKNIKKYIDKAKDKNDPFRLMGFGHRVYKNYDPRAKVLQKIAEKVLKEEHKLENKLFDLAKELENIALNDPYFIEKKLYPNVDFYSGIIYKALNIPNEMFTVMFALGRLPGWIAHWREMRTKKEPIGRPRQIYTGEKLREFISIDKR